MNAHHQKRSYRHSLPRAVEYLTMGSSLSGPAQGGKDNQSGGAKGKAKETAKEDRVWKGIARLPFGYQVRWPSLLDRAVDSG